MLCSMFRSSMACSNLHDTVGAGSPFVEQTNSMLAYGPTSNLLISFGMPAGHGPGGELHVSQ